MSSLLVHYSLMGVIWSDVLAMPYSCMEVSIRKVMFAHARPGKGQSHPNPETSLTV